MRRTLAAVSAALVVLLGVAGCQSPSSAGSDGAAGGQGQQSSGGGRPSGGGATGGTEPTQTGWGPTIAEWERAKRDVAKLSDNELAGQVIIADFGGTTPPVDLVKEYHLGGVILLGGNISSLAQVTAANRALQTSVHYGWPLVISTDQEGGIVERVPAPLTQFPTFMSYGAAADQSLTRQAARASGEELRAAGFTLVYAPDSDVTIGPSDPTIGSRSAGSDADAVAKQVVAAVQGYQQAGLPAVIKHFPGHGSVTTNSHVSLPVQDASLAELEARDLVPFRAAVHAHVDAVMVGHIAVTALDPGVPADLSKTDVSLLTSTMGFHGLVSTDALNMGAITDTMSSSTAAVDALEAGVDMILMPSDVGAAHDTIVSAMQSGALPRTRVLDAAAHIVALMLHEQAQPRPAYSVIGTHDPLSEKVSLRALTVVSGACTGPYVGSTVTPEGSSAVVAAFDAAAEKQGLAVGPGGTTVALIAYGYGPADADIVVSLDTPYVLASSQASVARLALFGSDPDAMSALVSVLTGHEVAGGHLPAQVSGLTDPASC